jgi:hypothetical protein
VGALVARAHARNEVVGAAYNPAQSPQPITTPYNSSQPLTTPHSPSQPRTTPQVIGAARQYIDSSAVFSLEDPSEALDRFKLALKVGYTTCYTTGYTTSYTRVTIRLHCVLTILAATFQVCGLFKSAYFDAKARSSTEVPDNPWDLQNGALFARLDAFLERCRDLLDLFRTVVQFRKLERIEIGGNKGRSLSASVVQIYSDFNGLLEIILNLPYDVLDVEVKQFDEDYYTFRAEIKELERRLGSVCSQGFEDQPSPPAFDPSF